MTTPSARHVPADGTPAPSVDAALLQRFDRPGPRYTSYPTAVEFHEGFDEAAYRAALRRAAGDPGPLSLYVHLPFCEARCLYCACNVVITPYRTVAAPYLERLVREFALVHEELGGGRRVSQVHLGGGTPTYYTPTQLRSLMASLRSYFTLAADAEVSVEVDPRVTTFEHLEVLADEGFARLSLGVQDFDPQVQEAVRRVQSVEDTHALMERARELGFGSLNVDLIYGLPHQNADSFARTVERVIALRPDRLAVYSFAYVPWLKHHQKGLPRAALPEGLEKFELLAVARERLLAAGYRAIGMDHFARPEDGLVRAQGEGRLQRNFMGYTTSQATDLIGFGSSAIGSVAGTYAQNAKKLSAYQRAIDAGRLPVERGYALDADDHLRRELIRQWMCGFRIDRRDLERRHGIDFGTYFAAELRELEPLADEGFVRIGRERIEAGELGALFPRNVAMIFDRHLRRRAGEAQRFSRTV